MFVRDMAGFVPIIGIICATNFGSSQTGQKRNKLSQFGLPIRLISLFPPNDRNGQLGDIMIYLGRRCRAARIATGFDNACDFAEAIGIGIERYVAIEGGTVDPTASEISLIANTTDRSIDFLVNGRARIAA